MRDRESAGAGRWRGRHPASILASIPGINIKQIFRYANVNIDSNQIVLGRLPASLWLMDPSLSLFLSVSLTLSLFASDCIARASLPLILSSINRYTKKKTVSYYVFRFILFFSVLLSVDDFIPIHGPLNSFIFFFYSLTHYVDSGREQNTTTNKHISS